METTLRKLISEIDKTKTTDPSWEELADFFNINGLYWSDDKRLKCYYIKKWLCADTWVGTKAYFLDDEFITLSNQTARKANEKFSFVSVESAKKLKTYLESLVIVDEETLDLDILTDEVLDTEIPSMFKLEYNTQILHDEGFLNGEKVQILKRIYEWEDKDRYFHTVQIKRADGKKQEIDCRELEFEYNKI